MSNRKTIGCPGTARVRRLFTLSLSARTVAILEYLTQLSELPKKFHPTNQREYTTHAVASLEALSRAPYLDPAALQRPQGLNDEHSICTPTSRTSSVHPSPDHSDDATPQQLHINAPTMNRWRSSGNSPVHSSSQTNGPLLMVHHISCVWIHWRALGTRIGGLSSR